MMEKIEIGIGAIFELPTKLSQNSIYLNDPLFWIKAKPFKDAKIVYRTLIELGYPLLFHIYAQNEEAANAQAIAIKYILGDFYDKVRYEGGVSPIKKPFNSICCIDDNIDYLVKSNAKMKAIIDRPYNQELICLEYKTAMNQIYRLEEPTQMISLVSFLNNRKDIFI